MKRMKDEKARIKKLVLLASTKVFDFDKGKIDIGKAIKITRLIKDGNYTNEELSYIRKYDGATLLHIAVYSGNAPLLAYFLDLGIGKKITLPCQVTLKDLVGKLSSTNKELQSAFNKSEDYLISNKVFEEFDYMSIDDNSEGEDIAEDDLTINKVSGESDTSSDSENDTDIIGENYLEDYDG